MKGREDWAGLCERFSSDYRGRYASVAIKEPGTGAARTVWRDRRLQRVEIEKDEGETVLSIVASNDKAGTDLICYRVEKPTALTADDTRLRVTAADGWETELRLGK